MRRFGILAAIAALTLAGSAAAADYKAPRNSYGQPDLGGVWNTDAILPLESTAEVTSLTLPEKEAAAYARKVADVAGELASLKIDGEIADIREHSALSGLAIVRGQRRTRQVVLPVDGKVPWTPRARAQVRAIEAIIRNADEPPIPTNNPEERPDWERCLAGQGQPPITTVTSANPREILQTRDAVVILTEYGPDLRIIPFSATHGPLMQAATLGDSIARWEGDTLVVETIGLPAHDAIRPVPTLLVPASAVIEERYTRLSDKELLYQYTVKDPAVYAAPWLAEYSLYRTAQPILEFACHEGNYSLPNILAAARAKEKAGR
jgi:hypothetical protein